MIYSIRRIKESFEIIDQTLLPHIEKYIQIDNYQQMIEAIKSLQIRGAPAIGIAATAAVYLAVCEYIDRDNFIEQITNAIIQIENSRPTAVNLHNATGNIRKILRKSDTALEFRKIVSDFVDELMSYELAACDRMAKNGFNLIPRKYTRFLTHCNTGSLATYGEGTALAVLKQIAKHREIHVWVDETRPLLQGSRLTMWELDRAGIPCTLITDNMAAFTIKTQKIEAIIVGADCIAQNGDVANKIGTFNLAILAKYFGIPFYVVAPESTKNNSIYSGDDIVIEQRYVIEVTHLSGQPITLQNAKVCNPAFDVTPTELITAVITDNFSE
jgi:methylthioribose-1-phosphate isomerase